MKPARPASSISLAPKKHSFGGGWIPKVVLTSVVALAVALFFLNVDRGAAHTAASAPAVATVAAAPAATPAPAPAPVVVSEVSLIQPDATKPTTEPKPEPKLEQGSEDVQVKPGQTLYQISVNKVGKYNGKVLSQLQDLNPWLSDPDRIHPGQTIRVPTAATNSTETQRAAQQASNAAPAEAGKQ